MKVVQLLLLVAACSILLLCAYYAEPAGPDWQPNPMKINLNK
ncbi:hypothetical protein [Paenibacillus hexagrammi]|nr:hypothetical protein [Paenibacillus sp. YPD9-1]